MSLSNEQICNYLLQQTKSEDTRKIRILYSIPRIMELFLSPTTQTFNVDERFINCLCVWKAEVFTKIKQSENSDDLIKYAITDLNNFMKILNFLYSKDLLLDNKNSFNDTLTFEAPNYKKLANYCGTSSTSKALRRISNFKKITKAFMANKIKYEDYQKEIEKQTKHFGYICNKFNTVNDLDDIPMLMILFDIRPKRKK
ncbi:MAG: hypothetical protein RSB67_00860 [Clostridia bacterium]